MAGPFCGMQLADLGADVVKIEDPRGGDLSRRLEPIVDGESGNFVRLNRGKRSVALDLKQEAGADIFRRLAERADVIVENLRPGTMRDLGLAPQTLLDANPRLIYAAVTGWGLDGPYADRPALDIIVQAMSGLMSVTGDEGGAPVKVGVSISDLAAGAVRDDRHPRCARRPPARGPRAARGHLDVRVVRLARGLGGRTVLHHRRDPAGGRIGAQARGSLSGRARRRRALRARRYDAEPTWRAFCGAIGLQRLERDPRFADGTLRRRNKAELIPLIEEVTATRPASHWLALLREAGVPCGEIQDYEQVFDDPHLRARGFFVDLPHPRLGTVRALGTPLRLRSSPARLERAGPLLGEHSAEVLREIGHSDDEVRAFVARGTVAAA